VERHPAANDEHTLVAERRQGAAERQVFFRIQAIYERQLDRRDLGIPIRQLEWNEGAVVVATIRIFTTRDTAVGQQFGTRAASTERPARLARLRD
jgi:hypothetical protein